MPDGGLADTSVIDASIAIDGSPAGDAAADAGDASMALACLAAEPCDPVGDTAGCPGSGVCQLSGEAPSCTSAAGAQPEGAACTTSAECAAGLACFLARDGKGVCDRVCCGDDAGPCADGERCGAGKLVDGTDVAWGRCLPADASCKLLDPVASCEPGEGCYVVTATGSTACRAAGTKQVDDPCQHQNDCAPGLACRGLMPSTCRRICDATAYDACPSGEGECVAQPLWPTGTGLCTLDAARLANVN